MSYDTFDDNNYNYDDNDNGDDDGNDDDNVENV